MADIAVVVGSPLLAQKPALAPRIIAAYSSNMRRAITLILYLALLDCGPYSELAGFAQARTGARFSVLVLAGCFLVLFGGYMLWTNFLSPNREKTIKKCRGRAPRLGRFNDRFRKPLA